MRRGVCQEAATEAEDATEADAARVLTVWALLTVADLGRVVAHITHPRSRWLERGLPSPQANFGMIARAADVSHAPNGGERRGGNAAQRPQRTDNTCKESQNTCDNLPPGIGPVLHDAAPREQQGQGPTMCGWSVDGQGLTMDAREDCCRNAGDGEMAGKEEAGMSSKEEALMSVKEEALRRMSKMLGQHPSLGLV